MFGFSLVHAGFLAAGLAVALPIVIHLLFRQRTRTVLIGSVRFLHQVVKEHRRRRRVRQWILLALRMLAVLLLALLFARPYWDASLRRGFEQEIVLLVDRSASMQATSGSQETSFDRALAKAKSVLSALDDNVIVHIALCDAAHVQEIPLEELGTASPSEAATDYGLALTWARDILATSKRATRQIVLITDLQRSGLSRTRMEKPSEGTEFIIHDVGQALSRNVSIESVEAIRTEIRPGSKVTVRAILRNFGPLPVRKVSATCELEKAGEAKRIVKQSVDIPGRGTVVVDFPQEIQTDGLYRGQLKIEQDDALLLDNHRWIAFEARHPERVLLVDGQEGRSSFNNETYFLETALRLHTEEADGRLRSFEVEKIVWESGEGFPRLDGFRVIVLANVRRLSAADGQRMDTYVRQGGSVLIFAGDQVSPESVAPLQEHGLLPGPVAMAPVEGRLRVDQWDAKHAALACFTDPQQGDLRRVEFHKVLPIESIAETSRILLQISGKIVAAERNVDKGRVLYFGSTADREWTDLPRTPMYVPLVRQLLAYLTDQLADRSAVTSQLVTKPDEKSGIAPAIEKEGHWIVTNVDPREFALDRLTQEELQKLLGFDTAKDHEDPSSAGIELPADSLRPDEIWHNIVWILLFVLAAETLLAGRVHA